MELMMVKNEENPGRRRLSTADRETEATRSVKRRRRDPPAVAVSCDNNQSEQQLPQKPADPTSATTMKRSSRFRGVSRFEHMHKIQWFSDCLRQNFLV
ncbi:hypothetical protein GBA52_025896 [Prunus armeniaca]|nr:hypothetical protein GBA52_025896 [Prunus armeniaca]